MFNAYFCFIDEIKLTEIEWNAIHAFEVANKLFDNYGYHHCNSYIAYSASFDRCMATQIANRELARKEYIWLKKNPFSAEWDERYAEFSDSFKSIYGRRPHFRANLLEEKGLSADTPWAC